MGREGPVTVSPLRLALNENPYRPLPSVRDALRHDIAEVNRYPEFLPVVLPRLIAERVGMTPEEVVVGVGATGVALQVLQALCQPGDSLVFAHPTFDGYPILADIAGLIQVPIPLADNGITDLDELLGAAYDADAAAVVLCRPHNPTGTLIPADQVYEFVRAAPPTSVVILDEAYIEFVDPEEHLDVPRLLAIHPNLVVLRTFSKAYGLAGLRIGYGLAAPAVCGVIRRYQLPFGMNRAAAVAVAASYAAEDELRLRVDSIVYERDRLRERLAQMGAHIPESHANFVYLPARGNGERWMSILGTDDVVAKEYPDGGVRLTVGDPREMAIVARRLLEVDEIGESAAPQLSRPAS
ncbi:aminotransferase class I/II-fold pyridoxal phosphate-dependent enzyme [Mycobacteroides chelonae]|uniref:aminotransferase class I/II-fold pyridoxal phosphate-dependent enzyme n=1 Tax=Mycobacteroides chelonae TaxID=1774 RepID=UPI001C2C0048|nr:aminotransferase class I/II-fold pyridoxal phosphate-dependent enzyme [Mycobacteroides chelonae]MBV0917761.1 aminotransferase class I/II-fold pyridoxal phosphate-dependent enzyme [Mycobacteroides chelonae]